MLDMRTIIITFSMTSFICAAVMFLFWRENRRNFKGLLLWTVGLAFRAVGFLLVVLRNDLTDGLSTLVAAVMLAFYSIFMLEGQKQFIGHRGKGIHNYVLLGVFALTYWLFIYVRTDAAIRAVLISVFLIVINFQASRIMLFGVRKEIKAITRTTGLVCMSYILIHLYRIGIVLNTRYRDLYDPNLPDAIANLLNIAYLMVYVIALISMVNSMHRYQGTLVQNKLEDSEYKFRTFADYTSDWEYWAHEDGRIEYMTPSVTRMTGYTPEEFSEDPELLRKITHPDDHKILDAHMSTKQAQIEFRIYHKNGEIRWIEHVCQVVYDTQGRPAGRRASNRDITLRKQIEQELVSSREEVIQANRAKSSFLTNMSHELRTPLNSVITLSGVLNRRLAGQVPQESYKYLEVIERSGRNLLAMINDILDISRIESGHVDLSIQRFNLNTLVRDLYQIQQPLARQKNIDILLDPANADLMIVSDERKLGQVIQNLLTNAVKFTEKGGVSLSFRLTGSRVAISIADTGIGISQDHLQDIFEEFQQADSATNRKYGGTGLGLTISRKYAELLGGTIEVQSTPAQGSVFTIDIPRQI